MIDENPWFSWKISHPEKSSFQTKYRIIVASHTPSFASDFIVWDSGIVTSNKTKEIEYTGAQMTSDTTYFWKITYWDQHNIQSPDSEIGRFSTAFLDQSLWQASWLGGGLTMYRRDFLLNHIEFQTAKVYIAAIGFYEVFLNGHKIGNNKLDPSATNPSKRIPYVVHDISNFLVQGSNCLGLSLGGGWNRQWFGTNPAIRVQVMIDGEIALKTDANWSGTNGPIVADSIYDGEIVDGTKEINGWLFPHYNDYKWPSAIIVTAPAGKLRLEDGAPVQQIRTVHCASIRRPTSGTYVFDFGQSITGWIRIRVQGTRGDKLVFRYAQLQNADGSIVVTSSTPADRFTLSGDSNGEEFQPKFTAHGFRFVEMTGYAGTVDLNMVEAIVVHSAVAHTGQASFNLHVLTQIQEAAQHSQAMNMLGLPTDSNDSRERFARLLLMHLNDWQAALNFDMETLYTHWADLISDDILGGAFPDTIPWGISNDQRRPADTSEAAALLLLNSALWRIYDNKRVPARHYERIRAWIDYLIEKAQTDGMNSLGSVISDLQQPHPMTSSSNPAYISAFYFVVCLEEFAALSATLGKSEAADYQNHAMTFSAMFTKVFYKTDAAYYDDGSETSTILPLATMIVPKSLWFNLTSSLLNNIHARHYHIGSGAIGAKYVLMALSDQYQTDVAVKMASAVSYPSWGYMFYQRHETTATSLWGSWDGGQHTGEESSRNSPLFSSISSFFYTHLIGIQQESWTSGFRHAVIAPPANDLIYSTLRAANGTVRVGSGSISVAWEMVGGDHVCGIAPEGSTLKLSCDTGLVSRIDFASYGNPHGDCAGRFKTDLNCNSQISSKMVESRCLGRKSCTVPVNSQTFGDPCYNVFKHLAVIVQCSNPLSFKLRVSVPQNTLADVLIPKLYLKDIQLSEQTTVFWASNVFFANAVHGILGVKDYGREIGVLVGGGTWHFSATGNKGTTVCALANEVKNKHCFEN